MGIAVTRIGGSDRYETSIEIAKKLGSAATAVIATGDNFPDALSIAPIAAIKGYPILLTYKDQLPYNVRAYISDNIDDTVVVGGTGVISNYVYNQLPSANRLSGADRYATNLSIIEAYADNLDFSSCYIATGEDFPDALAGAALASSERTPLLLTSSVVSSAASNLLREQDVNTIVALGGSSVVSGNVLNRLASTISGVSSALSAPKNLSATLENSDEIYLDWDAVPNATSYYVYRATSYNGTYTRIATVSTSYYYDTGLSADETYYYKVQAHNSSGTGAYSSRVSATTNTGDYLEAPTNLEATAESSSSIYLAWDSVPDATSYYIYRASSSSGTYVKIATVSHEYYTNSGLSSGMTYYYRVKAHNSSSTSNNSNRAYATTD
jgi:hypothetical protein